MIPVFSFIKIILILAFAYFLSKKSEKSETLQKTFMLFGSLFFAGFLVSVGWMIIEGFFPE